MPTPFPALDGSAPRQQQFDSSPELGIDTGKRYTATMETSMGTLVIALDAINAPLTVNNFVFLAAHHYYDGVIFHRIISGFVCQGGDPTGTGRGGPGYRFADEAVKQRYQIGSLAMANAGPNTNGSQFFIVYKDSQLPPSYTVFGHVDDAAVKIIKNVAKKGVDDANGPGDGHPLQEVHLEKITVD